MEPYWAFPGPDEFARTQRLFASGSYNQFSQAVTQINRALTTESYRSGDLKHIGHDDAERTSRRLCRLSVRNRRNRTQKLHTGRVGPARLSPSRVGYRRHGPLTKALRYPAVW